jgi:hypothetical protein
MRLNPTDQLAYYLVLTGFLNSIDEDPCNNISVQIFVANDQYFRLANFICEGKGYGKL